MQKIQRASLFFLIVLSMFLLSVQSIHIKESHENLKGVSPYSGFTIEYGCYQSKCWAYCPGLDKTWCWTNSVANLTKKTCSTDQNCNGYYYKCVSPCTP